ncbi:uncharacterized protein LODBEIA_P34390 [Lodderomyces beijingensis]|uniref:NAD(+) kinase n=1 Tax=Lodderomyces beijingensis TaxID=1775926 RepID=A0ABP0ZPS8_9ASCO
MNKSSENQSTNARTISDIRPLTRISSSSSSSVDPMDLRQIRDAKLRSSSMESSTSSSGSLATELQPQQTPPPASQQQQQQQSVNGFRSRSDSVPNLAQPQPQNSPSTSSFKRGGSVKKFNRSHFSLSTASSNDAATQHSSSGSPRDSFAREPKIHSKLYCEDVVASARTAKDVLSRLSTDELRSVRTHTELAETANGVRMLAKNLSRATIQLDVKAIMIVTKARDNALVYLTREVVEWLFSKHPEMIIYVDEKLVGSKRFNKEAIIKEYSVAKERLRYWNKELALRSPELFDLVVTLGGDGTVLFVSNLFQRIVPPVLSFALGSLGFLTNFKFDDFKERLTHCIHSGVRANLRMRFTCRVHSADGRLICEQQVLNEVVVDRGPSPFVTQLELYGDGNLLTIAQADGLIIATPTGSTAYSLSAGGSLVHPGVSAISVTPICPHTLSFRPILLPDGMFIKIKVPSSSRSHAWSSFDGRVRTELSRGYYVTVQASPFPFPTVISSKTEYIDSVSRNLHWNIREQQKPFGSCLKPETRQMMANDAGVHEDPLHHEEIADDGNEDFDINYDDHEVIREKRSSSSSAHASQDVSETTSEDFIYVPAPGGGTSTPSSYSNVEERECFAHPHARVHLNGDRN